MKSREAIVALSDARTVAAALKTKVAEAREVFEKDNKNLLDQYKAARELEAERDEAVRSLGLSMYKPDGSKQVFPGVVINAGTRLEYDEETAFEWAVEHEVALELNPNAFESVVKALPKLPPFVRSYPDNRATVSRDLGKVLAEWPEEEVSA